MKRFPFAAHSITANSVSAFLSKNFSGTESLMRGKLCTEQTVEVRHFPHPSAPVFCDYLAGRNQLFQKISEDEQQYLTLICTKLFR